MYRNLYFLLLMVSMLACQPESPKSQSPEEAQGPAPEKISKEISGFAAPECIVSHRKMLYVSNVGVLAPTKKDGDGFISRMDLDGNVDKLKWVEGLDAPKGMAIKDQVLYVTDIDRVKGFQLPDGNQVFDLDFSKDGVQFLNDITLGKDGVLLVSETILGKVFEVNTDGAGTYAALDIQGDIGGANGLFFDAKTNQLFLNSYGTNNEANGATGLINMGSKEKRFKALGEHRGYMDGLLVLGSLVVGSDWKKME
ncbi:MAG: hypothetical protein AAF985_07645, partial [Bacteroidota bacterium]